MPNYEEKTTIEVLRYLSEKAGSTYRLSKMMGKSGGYINAYLSEKGSMSCALMAQAADCVGLKLCLCEKPPKGSIVIKGEK